MPLVKKTRVPQWGGIEVSRLGFGAMRLPVLEDNKIDYGKASAMVDRAVSEGVNYFDTAYVYHGGESELFLGEALEKYPRDSYYLATKLPIWQVNSDEDFYKAFEEQLSRLRTDRIDFYLIHALNDSRWKTVLKHKIVDKLRKKRKEGQITYIGFSYHGDFETFNKIIDFGGWDFCQIQINYADYNIIGAEKYYERLVKENIPCICMEPVRGGFLANPPDEVRALMSGYANGRITPAGWALRWCINKENMPVILSGMTTMEQTVENIETFSEAGTLDPAHEEMIIRAGAILAGIKAFPCTYCGYCMDCPEGVDIPGVFGIYNQYQLFRNAFRSSVDYNDLTAGGHGADKCTKCGVCAPKCTQEIKIPDRLEEAKELLENLMK